MHINNLFARTFVSDAIFHINPEQLNNAYVLKEKIKRLKQRLKIWNQEQFGNILKKVKNQEAELNKLEEDTTQRQLTDQEMMERKQL